MSRDRRTLRNEFYGRKDFVFVDIQPRQEDLGRARSVGFGLQNYRRGCLPRGRHPYPHRRRLQSHANQRSKNLIGIREGQIINIRKLEHLNSI